MNIARDEVSGIWNQRVGGYIPGVIVRGVLFAGDELLGMVELSISPGPHFIDDGGFEVDKNGARNVFAGSRFGEKRIEGVVPAADRFVGRHLTIWLYPMLQAIKLPTTVADLHAGLNWVGA